MASVFILSMLSDLYFNLKINELSSDLEQINNEILNHWLQTIFCIIRDTEPKISAFVSRRPRGTKTH